MPNIEISNKNLLQAVLGTNETFTAGDFPVTIIDAQGSNGIYSGTGYVQVPYLADTKIKVVFNNIQLNTDRQLISGVVETSYDADESAVYYASNNSGANDEDNGINNNEGGNGKNNGDNEDDNNNGEKNSSGNENGDTENSGNNGDGNDNDVGNNDDETNGSNTSGNVTNNNNGTRNNDENTNNGGNNNETDYGIKYLNKVYKDSEAITILYKRGLKASFEIKGKDIDDKSKIEWTMPDNDTPTLFKYNGGNRLNDWIFGNYSIEKIKIGATAVELEEKPKVFVDLSIIEKKFKIKDFFISENDKRIAKNGETLYYINKKGVTDIKKTDFKFTTDVAISESEIRPENITWKLNNEIYPNGEGKKIINNYPVKEKDITISVTAGNTDKTTKSANIKWVDGYDVQFDVVSPAVKNALNQLSNYVNNIGSVLKMLDDTGKLEFNISFQGQEYLEEDKNSRFYNIMRDGGFSGSIDLAFKGFKYGADLKIAKAEIYLKPIVSLVGTGKMRYEKRNDKKEFVGKGIKMNFDLQADLQAGGEISFDIKAIRANLTPYSGVSSWGGVEYSNIDKSIKGKIGIGKPYVGVKGEILFKGYNILPNVDYKHIWEEIKIEKEIKLGL